MNINWLKDTYKEKKFLIQKDYVIGGSDEAIKKLEELQKGDESDEKNEQENKTIEKKHKLIYKLNLSRAAVDPIAEDYIQDYHVLDGGGNDLYDAVLNLNDIAKKSKFILWITNFETR